jgi:hypothetical protein
VNEPRLICRDYYPLFRLQGNEAKLEGIVAEQGSNVSSLVALVKENGEIIAAMDVSTSIYFLIIHFFLILSIK